MKKKQTIEELKSEGLVTTADTLESNFVFAKPNNESYDGKKIDQIKFDEYGQFPAFNDPIAIQKQIKRLKVLEEIEAYCGEMGILPADLIETHRQSLKIARKRLKQGKKETFEESDNYSTWRKQFIKSKTGYQKIKIYES